MMLDSLLTFVCLLDAAGRGRPPVRVQARHPGPGGVGLGAGDAAAPQRGLDPVPESEMETIKFSL